MVLFSHRVKIPEKGLICRKALETRWRSALASGLLNLIIILLANEIFTNVFHNQD